MALRVVVIDDEEDYRLILKDILEDSGYEVRLASDGVSGLSLVLERAPDLILVDWVMPQMNGLQFVISMRGHKDLKEIPIVMLTVNQTEDDKLEAIRAGVDDFMIKPFESEDLIGRIESLIKSKK